MKLKDFYQQILGAAVGTISYLLLVATLSLQVLQTQAKAQITSAPQDANTIVTSSGDRFDITGGTQAGANLFHSFEKFGLNTGQIANFSSNPSIQNILGRIVGGQPSLINGLIQVTGGNSNLYLVNPAGMIFGSNASLNVPASFTATTANGIGFGDRWLNAVGSNHYAALVGSPSSFAFTEQPGSIVNAGNLIVGAGQQLTLVGGTVINTGTISAREGTVTIATVPGEKLVRLSQEGNVLSLDLPIETKAVLNPQPFSPVSLAKLLAGGAAIEATGVIIEKGVIKLTGSGELIESGDITANTIDAKTATLSATNNLTLIESQISTAENLSLLAKNTVRVRDSITNPVVIQAGGKLVIQGDRTLDLFALNHSRSGLFSGKDLVLRSANPVMGDAHYFSRGSFRIEQLDGNLGNLVSPNDPIIRASGDVSFTSYKGASLHIFAGGNVTIPNGVEITGTDAINSIRDTVTLSNGTTTIAVNGSTRPTLDIRAGTTSFGTPGIQGTTTDFIPAAPTTGNPATSADITIGAIRVSAPDGLVLLTNQYQPRQNLPGGVIQVNGTIDTQSNSGSGGDVYIDARTKLTTQDITTLVTKNFQDPADPTDPASSPNNSGGLVALLAGETAQVGAITTSSRSGNAGNISIVAPDKITTRKLNARAATGSEFFLTSGGTVRLSAEFGDIQVDSIDTSSDNFSGGGGQGGGVFIQANNSFQATGFTQSGVGNSNVQIRTATGVAPDNSTNSGTSINTSGNISSTSNSFKGGEISLSYGTKNFVVGGVGEIPPNPTVDTFVTITYIPNFVIPAGDSGTVGAIVSRTTNGTFRVVFTEAGFISTPSGLASGFKVTAVSPKVKPIVGRNGGGTGDGGAGSGTDNRGAGGGTDDSGAGGGIDDGNRIETQVVQPQLNSQTSEGCNASSTPIASRGSANGTLDSSRRTSVTSNQTSENPCQLPAAEGEILQIRDR